MSESKQLTARVEPLLGEAAGGAITALEALGGGSTGDCFRVRREAGPDLFLKCPADAPAGAIAAEARGLAALASAGALRVPAVIAWDDELLLLEHIERGQPGRKFWEHFGAGLAAQHQHTGPYFGFEEDGFCGLGRQPNPRTESGFDFFAEARLGFQARLARAKGLLDTPQFDALERLAQRLPDLVPEQPPSLLHGDLWQGNWLSDQRGDPVVIDPAVYWGWAEADLAMTALFASPPEAFYRAYTTARPLDHGWRERFGLYNLYHLLNHLNLFGASYRPGILATLERWA